MKYMTVILTCLLLLAGCSKEACYLDREYGLASQAAWDQQVLYTDYRHAAKTPEDMQGITAEEVIDVHNTTYGEAPEDIDVFQFDVEQ